MQIKRLFCKRSDGNRLIDCGEHGFLEKRANSAKLVYFWSNRKLFSKVVDVSGAAEHVKFRADIVKLKLSLGINEDIYANTFVSRVNLYLILFVFCFHEWSGILN